MTEQDRLLYISRNRHQSGQEDVTSFIEAFLGRVQTLGMNVVDRAAILLRKPSIKEGKMKEDVLTIARGQRDSYAYSNSLFTTKGVYGQTREVDVSSRTFDQQLFETLNMQLAQAEGDPYKRFDVFAQHERIKSADMFGHVVPFSSIIKLHLCREEIDTFISRVAPEAHMLEGGHYFDVQPVSDPSISSSRLVYVTANRHIAVQPNAEHIDPTLSGIPESYDHRFSERTHFLIDYEGAVKDLIEMGRNPASMRLGTVITELEELYSPALKPICSTFYMDRHVAGEAEKILADYRLQNGQ